MINNKFRLDAGKGYFIFYFFLTQCVCINKILMTDDEFDNIG